MTEGPDRVMVAMELRVVVSREITTEVRERETGDTNSKASSP